MTIEAKPFCKWAGGKRALLPELLARMPKNWNRYYEPFVGGGALFFALRARDVNTEFFLSDTNGDLINAYREIRERPNQLIRRLRGMKNDERFYYRVRDFDIDTIPDDEPGKESARAARFIYLNRTCFNGLYRVNRSGRFNVPFGGYASPLICDAKNIKAVSRALRKVHLYRLPFHVTMLQSTRGRDTPSAGDFVYFDPPYMPMTKTSMFTAYTPNGFGFAQHTQLRDVALELKRRGVHVMISNSNHPEIRKLYAKGFKVEEVTASRSVAANHERRGAIIDLIIR